MAELGVSIVSDGTDPNNPDAGDLLLDALGREVLVTDLAQEVAQRLTTRFQFEKGEWPLDLTEGTPFYSTILTKNPGDRVIRAVFDQVILGTEGVSQMVSFDYTITPQRVMSVSFRCRLTNGVTFVSSDFGTFVVQLNDVRTQAALTDTV